MKYKIAFIGCGSMGSAMLSGITGSGLAQPEEIIAAVPTEGSQERLRKTYGITVTADNAEAARNAEIVILAVKPAVVPSVAGELKDVLSAEQILISVAAGISVAKLEELFMSMELVGKIQIVRAMPNTPAAVGQAMTAAVPNAHITPENLDRAMKLLGSFGRAEIVPESLMDTVTGLSGSGPAFIYMLIEAMADEAVREGMTRDKAYVFAAQTVLGSAQMVLSTGEHPGALKDKVCSPHGTTIAGVAALEHAGFRSAMMDGVRAAYERSKEL